MTARRFPFSYSSFFSKLIGVKRNAHYIIIIMGLPGFATWLKRKYPQGFQPLTSASSSNLEPDVLLLDLQSLLHTVIRKGEVTCCSDIAMTMFAYAHVPHECSRPPVLPLAHPLLFTQHAREATFTSSSISAWMPYSRR